MFEKRSERLERIDTGDYTPAEYDRFLKDIRIVNRLAGDERALRRTLFRRIAADGPKEFSVLDVGAGSGELLRSTARFAAARNMRARLCGLELNPRSAEMIRIESAGFPEIESIRGDALRMPFADESFDYVISSLFAHHLPDGQISTAVAEMSRVASKAVFVIDLHRHPMAYAAYQAFCAAFRISRLVREDGSLSILRGFKPAELEVLARNAGVENFEVIRSAPFRLVLRIERGLSPGPR